MLPASTRLIRPAGTATRNQGQQHRTQAGYNDGGDAPAYIRLKPLRPLMYAGQGPVLRVIMRLGPRPLTDAEPSCLTTITVARLPCMIAPNPGLAPNHRPPHSHHGAPGLGPRADAWSPCFLQEPARSAAGYLRYGSQIPRLVIMCGDYERQQGAAMVATPQPIPISRIIARHCTRAKARCSEWGAGR